VRKCFDIWRALPKGNSKRKAARDEHKSEGCQRGLGLASHIAIPVLNRLTHLSIAERLYAESYRTDFSSLCISLLPGPFIEKDLIGILCSDFSILIFDRRQTSDDEKINVSTDRKGILNFPCEHEKGQLMSHILLPSSNLSDLAIPVEGV
jgi:hypothetical protein